MSYPFILWHEQRTGSNTLFNALCRLSEHKVSGGEPFDPERGVRKEPPQFGDVCLMNDRARDRALWDICGHKWLVRHCYERLPLAFNIALANAAKHNGYRNVHLSRRDELARLVSKGIAEQHGTWEPTGTTVRTYDEIKSGRKRLGRLDVSELMKWKHVADAQWRAIRGEVDVHEVRTEDLFSGPRDDRVRTFMRVTDHLHLQTEPERDLLKGNQHTPELLSLVPNVDELRRALHKERQAA